MKADNENGERSIVAGKHENVKAKAMSEMKMKAAKAMKMANVWRKVNLNQ